MGGFEGAYRKCAEDLSVTASEPTVQQKMHALAYRCLIAAKDLSGANTQLQTLGGVTRVEAKQAIAHGWLLMEHHRAADVPTFLAPLETKTLKPSEKKGVYALHIAALVTSGDVERALAIATGKEARTEYNLAVLLYNAGRYEEAEKVLQRACPNASSEFQSECTKFIEIVQNAE